MFNKNLVVDNIWLRMWWLSEHYRKNQCVFVGRSPITRMFPARWLLLLWINQENSETQSETEETPGATESDQEQSSESWWQSHSYNDALWVSWHLSSWWQIYVGLCTLESSAVHHFLFAAVCATLILWAAGGRKAGLDPCTHVQSVHLYSQRRGRPLMSGSGGWTLVTGHTVSSSGRALIFTRAGLWLSSPRHQQSAGHRGGQSGLRRAQSCIRSERWCSD